MKKIFLVVGISLVLTSCHTQKEKIKKPNIIFIMTDDHSYQTLSAYDKRYIQTPNLDRIANEGVKFVNSFVSNSICAPSRAVMLTGKHSHINGQKDNFTKFNGKQLTFPKILQKAGYQTSLIGKWHLKSNPTGFDNWEILIGQGNYYNSVFIENGTQKKSKGYVTDVITNKAMNWLNERNKQQPFCLLVHHKAAHRIWMPNTNDLVGKTDKIYPLPSNFYDDYKERKAAALNKMSIEKDLHLTYDLKMDDDSISDIYKESFRNRYHRMNDDDKKKWDAYYQPILEKLKSDGLTGKELQEWKYQRYMNDYIKVIKSLDDNIGKLLNYLDSNHLSDNTLLVYTSDQGFYMGEHGWFDKRFMYEESLRTPLLMRYPAKIKKGIVDKMVQNIDYAPTILDFAGVPIPNDIQGKSIKPILEGKDVPWRDAIYYHYYEFPNEHGVQKHYGIRTNRYKLIHFYKNIDEWELYDLKNDPNEMHNIINNKKYATLIVELKAKLKELKKQYKVPSSVGN